jgi:hypothetical protein
MWIRKMMVCTHVRFQPFSTRRLIVLPANVDCGRLHRFLDGAGRQIRIDTVERIREHLRISAGNAAASAPGGVGEAALPAATITPSIELCFTPLQRLRSYGKIGSILWWVSAVESAGSTRRTIDRKVREAASRNLIIVARRARQNLAAGSSWVG